MAETKELWLECKEPCRDCPKVMSYSVKLHCQHLWRHLIANELEASGDGTVPFATPERAVFLGATVSQHEINGRRPSVQLSDQEPVKKYGMQVARVTEN